MRSRLPQPSKLFSFIQAEIEDKKEGPILYDDIDALAEYFYNGISQSATLQEFRHYHTTFTIEHLYELPNGGGYEWRL